MIIGVHFFKFTKFKKLLKIRGVCIVNENENNLLGEKL